MNEQETKNVIEITPAACEKCKSEKFTGYDIDVNFELEVDCDKSARHSKERELARAYVPYQKAGRLFSPATSLFKGTVFPELYKPALPKNV